MRAPNKLVMAALFGLSQAKPSNIEVLPSSGSSSGSSVLPAVQSGDIPYGTLPGPLTKPSWPRNYPSAGGAPIFTPYSSSGGVYPSSGRYPSGGSGCSSGGCGSSLGSQPSYGSSGFNPGWSSGSSWSGSGSSGYNPGQTVGSWSTLPARLPSNSYAPSPCGSSSSTSLCGSSGGRGGGCFGSTMIGSLMPSGGGGCGQSSYPRPSYPIPWRMGGRSWGSKLQYTRPAPAIQSALPVVSSSGSSTSSGSSSSGCGSCGK